jgi:hypothetical protein
VKAAIRVTQGTKYVEEELSMYYLTLEVAQMGTGAQTPSVSGEMWPSPVA